MASDHADTPAIAARPGADLTDVFIFPSKTNPNNVVLAMCVNPLITPSTKDSVAFDPDVLYQFKIDNTGDNVEDLVIQMKANGIGPSQQIKVTAPVTPSRIGTVAEAMSFTGTGNFNSSFTGAGMQVFAGVREDPFFFDLEQFFTILPDRATPINGIAVSDPNTPKATSWRSAGTAVDFLSNGKYSALAFVVEVPKSTLTPGTNKKIRVWATTSVKQ